MKKVISLILALVLGLCNSVSCLAVKTVFVEGCCCSDDIQYYINPNDKIKYVGSTRCVDIISLVSSKPKIDLSLLMQDRDNWSKKTVLEDINKTFFDKLKKSNPDILLIDFGDERCDLFKINNSYLLDCGYGLGCHPNFRNYILKNSQVIGEEQRLNLWKTSFDTFVKRVNETIGPNKIVINKIYHAKQSIDKDNKYTPFNLNYVNNKNKMLNEYYNYVRTKYPKIKFLEYNPSLFVGKKEHRWTRSSLHYIDALYRNTIDQLNKL